MLPVLTQQYPQAGYIAAVPRSVGAAPVSVPLMPSAASQPSSITGANSLYRTFSSMLAKPAVKACDYVPDAKDDIDVELSEFLKALRPEAAAKLCLLRKAPGRYDIAGRQVALLRMDSTDDDEESDIVVREEDSVDANVCIPLGTYLEQAVHVTLFIENKPQHKKDLTFGDARIPDDTDPFTARLMCMRLACDQAERRQAHEDRQVRQVGQPTVPHSAATPTAARNGAAPKASAAAPKSATGGAAVKSNTKLTAEAHNTAESKKKAKPPPRTRSWWERWTGAADEDEDEDEDDDGEEDPKVIK